jgi:hypothetical protein
MESINEYINWGMIWSEKVELKCQLEYLQPLHLDNAKAFLNDKKVELDSSECEIQDDELLFQFSETGGQNESDTQGWFRCYWFRVDPSNEFEVTDSGYEQG